MPLQHRTASLCWLEVHKSYRAVCLNGAASHQSGSSTAMRNAAAPVLLLAPECRRRRCARRSDLADRAVSSSIGCFSVLVAY